MTLPLISVSKSFGVYDHLVSLFSEEVVEDAMNTWRFEKMNRISAWGHCSYSKRRIRISNLLFSDPSYRDELMETFYHELAHLFDDYLYNSHGHGESWKSLMRKFGYSNPGQIKKENNDLREEIVNKKREEAKWKYECTTCNYVHHTHRRLKNINNRFHAPCYRNGNGGRFKEIKLR